jgi:hypothetical protein
VRQAIVQLRQVMVAEGPGYPIGAEGRSRVVVVRVAAGMGHAAARTKGTAAEQEALSALAGDLQHPGSTPGAQIEIV